MRKLDSININDSITGKLMITQPGIQDKFTSNGINPFIKQDQIIENAYDTERSNDKIINEESIRFKDKDDDEEIDQNDISIRYEEEKNAEKPSGSGKHLTNHITLQNEDVLTPDNKEKEYKFPIKRDSLEFINLKALNLNSFNQFDSMSPNIVRRYNKTNVSKFY